MIIPTLRQLQFLVALGETGSFSRAAEACHVTQPTLSAGIRELEDLLGVKLAEREARGAHRGRATRSHRPSARCTPRPTPATSGHERPLSDTWHPARGRDRVCCNTAALRERMAKLERLGYAREEIIRQLQEEGFGTGILFLFGVDCTFSFGTNE